MKIRATYNFSASLLLIAFLAGITIPSVSNCMVFNFSDDNSAVDMHTSASMSCCSSMNMVDSDDINSVDSMASCGMSSINCFCDAASEFPVSDVVFSLNSEIPVFTVSVLSELILNDSADEKPSFSHTELTDSYSSPPLFQVHEAWLN